MLNLSREEQRERLPEDELERNLLLRRIDWRFLLAAPVSATTIQFGADATLRRALSLMSCKVVDLAHARPEAADLAVLVAPRKEDLRSAWVALRPGGACYVEWSRPYVASSRLASRQLTQAGFAGVTLFWTWPHPRTSSARFWIPLGARTIQRYFLATRPVRPGLWATIRRRALILVWQAANLTGVLAPIVSVARKPLTNASATVSQSMNLDLEAYLADIWAPGTRAGYARPRLQWCVLTGGTASFNKVVGLVADDRSGPRVAVKFARSFVAEGGLRKEADCLEQLANERPYVQGVPRLLFFRDFAAGPVLAETAVHGRPVGETLTRSNLREIAHATTDWFATLAEGGTPTPKAEWWPTLVEPLLNGFADLPGPAVVPHLVMRTRARFASLDALPLCFTHGDAGPLNVVRDEQQRISVIDWEDGDSRGLPVADLIALFTYLVFHIENPWRTGAYRAVYRSTLDPRHSYGQLRLECLRTYSKRLGLDPSCVAPLAVLPWLQRSLREHRGMHDATLGAEGREAFRRGLYVSLWEEQLRASEFA